MNKFKLNHCPNCNSMTNHIGDVCQRCKKLTDKIRKEEREKDIKVVWNAVCANIEKEAYEQGFKDACEKWENMIRERKDTIGQLFATEQSIDFYKAVHESINTFDFILSLAEKENLLPPKEK